jgi:hypothetical protein
MWRVWRSSVPIVLFSCLLLDGATFSRPLFAQESHCDSHLNQTSDDPSGYRLRGDRCEGIYIKEVAGEALRVVSLTESVEAFDTAAAKNLLLEWTTPGNAAIHLRAYALRERLHYQMDTIRPADDTSYSWPSNLLATLNLTRDELGIVAWTQYAAGNTNRELYMPLRIRQRAATIPSQSYKLVLMPGVELAEVFISLAPVGQDGQLGAFITKDQPLKPGYYPAERGITITIPKPKRAGVYYVEIGATLRSRGSSTATVWFYHRGK